MTANFHTFQPIVHNGVASYEFQFSEDIAGPSEEIDKLMAVKWSMISRASQGEDPVSFFECRRTGPNSMVVEAVAYEVIMM